MFKVTDRVQMKRNLQKIDTYGISPVVLKKHRNTVFKIRKIHEDEAAQYAIRFYGIGENKDLRLAYWNPEMFEKVEVDKMYDRIKRRKKIMIAVLTVLTVLLCINAFLFLLALVYSKDVYFAKGALLSALGILFAGSTIKNLKGGF